MQQQIEALLRDIPSLRGRAMAVSPLSGGITNRNYRVDAGDERFVLRIGGEGTALLGIDRDCEHACSLAAAALGVAPAVIAYLPDSNALLTRFVEGRVLEPEDVRQPAVLRRVVESLRRYHRGPPVPGAFSPFETVRTYYALARQRDVRVPPEIDRALSAMTAIEDALRSDEPPCPCHNDLLPANLVDDGATIRIIDWEYAGMGDRFFDLGNLAVNNDFGDEEERLLLDLYFGEASPGHLERLRLMRLASDMRESMWGFLQAGISTLDFDFLGYGRRHLHRFLETAASLGHPLGPGTLDPGTPEVGTLNPDPLSATV